MSKRWVLLLTLLISSSITYVSSQCTTSIGTSLGLNCFSQVSPKPSNLKTALYASFASTAISRFESLSCGTGRGLTSLEIASLECLIPTSTLLQIRVHTTCSTLNGAMKECLDMPNSSNDVCIETYLGNFLAQTYGYHVFFRDTSSYTYSEMLSLIAREAIHVWQQETFGTLAYFTSYYKQYLELESFHEITFEREASAFQIYFNNPANRCSAELAWICLFETGANLPNNAFGQKVISGSVDSRLYQSTYGCEPYMAWKFDPNTQCLQDASGMYLSASALVPEADASVMTQPIYARLARSSTCIVRWTVTYANSFPSFPGNNIYALRAVDTSSVVPGATTFGTVLRTNLGFYLSGSDASSLSIVALKRSTRSSCTNCLASGHTIVPLSTLATTNFAFDIVNCASYAYADCASYPQICTISQCVSSSPSRKPSASPTKTPSHKPSISPSASPITLEPSMRPNTGSPSKKPSTSTPSKRPTTSKPSKRPTTSRPSKAPIFTFSPSKKPSTGKPSKRPSTSRPSRRPSTSKPSRSPTHVPSKRPSISRPSKRPTTSRPSKSPVLTFSPSKKPSTSKPSKRPSMSRPSKRPTTTRPSKSPTLLA